MKQCRSLRGDPDAVLEMPYKLMITVIVMAMVLPVVLESASVLEDKSAELELGAQCELLADSVIAVYFSGEGSVRLVSLDLPEDTAYLAAGASFEKGTRGDAISIRYKLIGGEIQKLTVRCGPVYIPMCSDDMEAFKIHGEGEHSIRIRKCMIEKDLNGDGLTPDHYVEFTRS